MEEKDLNKKRIGGDNLNITNFFPDKEEDVKKSFADNISEINKFFDERNKHIKDVILNDEMSPLNNVEENKEHTINIDNDSLKEQAQEDNNTITMDTESIKRELEDIKNEIFHGGENIRNNANDTDDELFKEINAALKEKSDAAFGSESDFEKSLANTKIVYNDSLDTDDDFFEDEDNTNKMNKILKIIIISFLSILLVGGGIFAFMLLKDKKIEIPNFIGKDIVEVKEWLNDNNIDSNNLKEIFEFSDDYEKDIVISQDKKTGTKISKKDFSLTITVSKGEDPNGYWSFGNDLKGLNKKQIEDYLISHGFTNYSFEYKKDSVIEKDKFVSINTNKSVKRTDPIIIYISNGDEEVIDNTIVMPKFIGKLYSSIEDWIKKNEIKITCVEEESEKDSGIILKQSIDAGEKLKKGDKLTLTISKNNSKITAFEGKTKNDFIKYAKEYDLTVTYTGVYSADDSENTIVAMSPVASKLKKGDSVEVFVALGDIIVPNFVKKSESDVKAWVNKINDKVYYSDEKISYSVSKEESTDIDEDKIIKTSPGNGKKINLDSTLSVTISSGRVYNIESKSNISIDEFKKYLSNNGMTIGTKTEKYNTNIYSGLLISNDSGKKAAGSKINYVVSLGAYSPTPANFEGISDSEAKAIIEDANSKDAGWSYTSSKEFSNTVAKDKTFNCSKNNKVLTCKVSLGKEPTKVTVTSFANDSLINFSSFIALNNLTLGTRSDEYSDTVAEGNIIYNDTGEFVEGSAIDYIVSLGARPTITVTDAQVAALDNCVAVGDPDATKANIESYITDSLGFPGPTVIIEFNDRPAGYIISADDFIAGSYNLGKVFSFKVSKGPETE